MQHASTTLVLVRHGRASDVDGRCIGHTDVPLSPDGAKAIQELCTAWRDAGLLTTGAPTEIHSSDLRRAVESARIIGAAWGIPARRDARLREMSFGEWDGQSWASIERDDGERLRAWTNQWLDTSPPSGEGIAELHRRVVGWMDEVVRPVTFVPRTIVVVSHAGWIRMALTELLKLPVAGMFEIPVEHAGATVVALGAEGALVMASNITL